MFKDFIKETAGIQLYPIISLCVFVLFFVVLSIRAAMYKKSELHELSSIPLDGTDEVKNDEEVKQ
jgi:hypothetical protein